MKKAIITFGIIIGTVLTMNAQDISKNAIGLRLGDNDGFGGEISYQRALGDSNRLELDLGIRSGKGYNGFKIAGLYQWVWNIDGGFNWYAGAGGGLFSVSPDAGDSKSFIFGAGDIGIEYNFDFPLVISLDARPEIYFDDLADDFDIFDIALGIRYQF
jgi:hypothetical protein